MAHITADRVKESTTTTGTGALTLAGAITGFRAFSAVCATSDTAHYAIHAVDGSGVPTGDWEVGLGTYSGANTLTRTTVLASSNAGAAVNFAAGTKHAWIDLPASQLATLAGITNLLVAQPANPGFDPLFVGPASAVTLSNSNKTATPTSGVPFNHMFGTPPRWTGRRYMEIVPSSANYTAVGLAGGGGHLKQGDGGNIGVAIVGQIGWDSTGAVKTLKYYASPAVPSTTLSTIQTWAAADTCCIAADLDAMLVWFRTNGGNWNNNASNNPSTGVGGIDLSWALSGASNNLIWPAMNAGVTGAQTMRLLAVDFTQPMPSGYTAWGA